MHEWRDSHWFLVRGVAEVEWDGPSSGSEWSEQGPLAASFTH
mgnify:CR=1 FL=1